MIDFPLSLSLVVVGEHVVGQVVGVGRFDLAVVVLVVVEPVVLEEAVVSGLVLLFLRCRGDFLLVRLANLRKGISDMYYVCMYT